MTFDKQAVWFENGEARVSNALLGDAFAGTYAMAASARYDMRKVAELIETSRERIPDCNDPFACMQSLTQMAAYVEEDEMASVLVDAVSRVRGQTCEAFIEHTQSQPDPDQQWKDLLNMLGSALAVWDIGACLQLLTAGFSQNLGDRELVDWLVRWLPSVEEERWPLNGAVFERLSREGLLSDRHRALCVARLGLIVLLCEGRFVEGRRLIEKGRDMVDATEPEIEVSLAEYWLYMGKPHIATRVAEDAVNRWPGYADLYSMLARVAESEADTARAESWYIHAQSRAISSWPSIRDHAVLRVGSSGGKPDELAEKLAERSILVERDEGWKYAVEMANAYLGVNGSEDAHRWALRACELRPDAPTAQVTLGKCLAREQADQSRRCFDIAMQKDNFAAGDIATNIGQHWQSNEDLDEAARWFEKALIQVECNPRMRANYRARLAEMQLKQGAPDRAVAELRELLTVEDDLWVALSPLIDHYGEQPLEVAKEGYMTLLEVTNPKLHYYIHNGLGNLAYSSKEYGVAAEAYAAAVAADENDPVLRRNLAGAYRELQHWDIAEKEIQLAFEMDGSERERDDALALLYNLHGNAFYHDGDYDSAVSWYRRAADADPSDFILHRNLATALLKEKQPGERVTAYREAARAWDLAVRAGGDYGDRLNNTRDLANFAEDYGEEIFDWTPAVDALQLKISQELVEFYADENNDLLEQIQDLVNEFRAWFKDSFGVNVPGVRFVGDQDIDPGSYVGILYGQALVEGQVELTERLYTGPAELLESIDVTAKSTTDPFNSRPAFWIAEQDVARVEAAGGQVWSVAKYPIYDLMRAMLGDLKQFVGYQEVVNLLEKSNKPAAGRFTGVDQRRILTRVINGIVAEQVSIEPFGEICEVVANGIDEGDSITAMVENVRAIPAMLTSLTGIDPDTILLELDADSESRFARSVVRQGSEPVLAGSADDCQALMSTIRERLADKQNVVIVVDGNELRPHVRRLYEYEFPRLPVVSAAEVAHLGRNVQTKADS